VTVTAHLPLPVQSAWPAPGPEVTLAPEHQVYL